MTSESRVAVVTGAARGIGRQTALTLTERGYTVATNDLETPEVTLGEIEKLGGKALSLPGDVSDEEAVRSMARSVMDVFGRADVLVNNAGLMFLKPAEETELADWRRVVEVTSRGRF